MKKDPIKFTSYSKFHRYIYKTIDYYFRIRVRIHLRLNLFFSRIFFTSFKMTQSRFSNSIFRLILEWILTNNNVCFVRHIIHPKFSLEKNKKHNLQHKVKRYRKSKDKSILTCPVLL